MTRQIRLIVTFGSVAGRYGLAGEGLLALASASLAERAERMADGIPGCQAVHVYWPAWSGPGLGQRGSLLDGLARLGDGRVPALAETLALPACRGFRDGVQVIVTTDRALTAAGPSREGQRWVVLRASGFAGPARDEAPAKLPVEPWLGIDGPGCVPALLRGGWREARHGS